MNWAAANAPTTERSAFEVLYMQGWCPGAVEVRGHYVNCDLGDHHDGSCIAKISTVREHMGAGSKACKIARCGS